LYFQPGNTVSLYVRGKERRVELGQSLESTASYSQFQAKLLTDEQPTDAAAGSVAGVRNAWEFDELWATFH
jgi:hypothetical protein